MSEITPENVQEQVNILKYGNIHNKNKGTQIVSINKHNKKIRKTCFFIDIPLKPYKENKYNQ